jgi:two-component system chemotaxis response regulator CheB
MIKVMVVDDSVFMRKVIADIVNHEPDMEVIGSCRNGQESLEMIKKLNPDVITMDVEMPVMDGIQALGAIMKEHPLPVIMLSSLTQTGADATMKALHLGAVDFVPKPSGSISLDLEKVAEELVSKLRIAASLRDRLGLVRPGPHLKEMPQPAKVSAGQGSLAKLVLIGTSTGGPKALHEVIPHLPGDLPAGVLVVQHMPPGFTRSLAERLNSLSAVTVKEAQDGEAVRQGHVYIAPGDFHLKVKHIGDFSNRRLLVNLTQDPPVSGHRPAVDSMILSAVKEFWGPLVGVIMTGMGQDGTKGAMAIKEKGGKVIAEDKSSCIVFGMPKSVIETGNADKIVPLTGIAHEITKAV